MTTKKKSSEYAKFRVNNNGDANLNAMSLIVKMVDLRALDNFGHYSEYFTISGERFDCYFRKGKVSIIIDIEKA